MRRYVLLQLPATLAVGAALIIAVRGEWLSAGYALGLTALWVLKDVVLYPFVHRAYERTNDTAAAKWIGRLGRAQEDLAPSGYVVIAGELWRANAAAPDAPIRAGERVRVEAVDGATLRVRRAHGDETFRST